MPRLSAGADLREQRQSSGPRVDRPGGGRFSELLDTRVGSAVQWASESGRGRCRASELVNRGWGKEMCWVLWIKSDVLTVSFSANDNE